MIQYPENFYFTKEHEWVSIIDGTTAYIGLTNVALSEIQVIESVEVDTLYQFLNKEQVFARIRTGRYLYKLIMPFCGTVVEINSRNINKITSDNWLVKVHPQLPIDMSGLLSRDEYKSYNTETVFHMIKYFITK